MASTSGPEAEFYDPRRKQLLQALKDALPTYVLIRPTALACLWLSDIDKLEELVTKAQADPTLMQAALEGMKSARIVPTCRLLKPFLNDC
jgi:hypothetical protein